MKNILITGGAGFIGSHVVHYFVKKYADYHIFNLDALTYAGNLENLKDIEGASNYQFIKGDIQDSEILNQIFQEYQIEGVIHLAAESHVDRSIHDPLSFVKTNIIGTCQLLLTAREYWSGAKDRLFYHVSTDEVYGSLGSEGLFSETTPYDPRSPYSASKAGSDHFVRAFYHTYNLPVMISNCSNNYGPYQFPEKLIPLIINNILNEKPLPVYGDGSNIRDWLWVGDHVAAIDTIFHQGKVGDTYNIGGENEMKNIDLVELLCDLMDEKLKRPSGFSRQFITFVKDRPGHDQRYAIDAGKLANELDWRPRVTPTEGLKKTIDWYLSNKEWLAHITSGDYQDYYQKYYEDK